MTHKSYNTSTEKLRKLWNLISNQFSKLNKNLPEDNFNELLENKELNDSLVTLYESDFQSITLPKPPFPLTVGSRTTTRGTDVGVRFNYQVQIPEIDLPEDLLPFLNYKIVFKTIPDTQILPIHLWEYDRAVVTEQVTVSGTEIFNGESEVKTYRYQQEDIDSGRVLEDALKKAWYIFKMGDLDDGYINKLVLTYDSVPQTGDCAGNTARKVILIDYHNASKHRIQQLSTTGFSGIGDMTEFSYASDGNGGCIETVTKVSGVVTQNWANADSFVLSLETSNGIPNGAITGAPDTVIESGYWLYFGQDKYPPRVGFENVGGDDTLQETPSVDIGEIVATPIVTDTPTSIIEPSNGEQFLIFDRNESGEQQGTKKYFIHVGGDAVAISNKVDNDGDILEDTKINTFTWNGGTEEYDESLSGDFTKDQYKFPTQDIQFKLILTMKNPFYSRKQENFNEKL